MTAFEAVSLGQVARTHARHSRRRGIAAAVLLIASMWLVGTPWIVLTLSWGIYLTYLSIVSRTRAARSLALQRDARSWVTR